MQIRLAVVLYSIKKGSTLLRKDLLVCVVICRLLAFILVSISVQPLAIF